MDFFGCWHTRPIHRCFHRCYGRRGCSKWDEGEVVTCGSVQSSPGLSHNTSSSVDNIVRSDTLLTLDDTLLPLLESDAGFRKVYEFLCSEKCYLDDLCCALDACVEPIRKMQSLAPEEVRILFCDLEPLACCSRNLCTQLKYAITKWDRNSSQIGHLFNDGFWNLYEAYSSHHVHISRLAVSKCSSNSEFGEFCQRLESLGKPSLDSLLNMPMKRLASYASELRDMASDMDSNNPDVPVLMQAANEAASKLVKLRKNDGNENYLKQLQEHFPQDDLRLMDKVGHYSAACRWRSSVTKTLIGGGLKKSSMPSSSSVGSMSSPDTKCVVPERHLILDSAAKLIIGVHSRERYLFLFNDFLIIAKGRYDTNFRLKNKLMTSNLWVTECSEKTLVIGWPMQIATFVFESSFHRDLWLTNLKELIRTEKAKETPQSIQIKIVKKDCEYTAIKSLLVANNETTSQVVERCLDEFHILDATVADFQLCVFSTDDETTFSLSGHEYPFTIWTNSSQTSAEGSASDAKIQFILRNSKKTALRQIIGENSKPVRKGKALKRLFKKTSSKQGHLKLFGRELSELCEQDATTIPYPIMQILRKLYMDGPHTDGVFRKSANHAKLLTVKQSLDCGEFVNFDEIPVPLAAVLLKEFLRNLPNCLLNCQLYHEWMKTASIPDHEEQITRIKQLTQLLPPCNRLLLRHLMCVLCNLARHSEECKMDAYNLAICVGQSLLWSGASVSLKEDAQNVNILVQQMINFATDIFGHDCLTLLNGAGVIKRPTQMALCSISADSESMQSPGEAEDSVCNSLDLEFTCSCSEAECSPIVPDKADFRMQGSQSYDSGFHLLDEVQECRDVISASDIPTSAKINYTSSESREEEEECKQLMPKKLRHSKKPAPGIPVFQEISSVDNLSFVQADSLCVDSVEYPLSESVDPSSLSFSDVLPTESRIKPSLPPVDGPSKRMLFFQSILQPPANSFSMSLGKPVSIVLTPKSVKSQKKLSTNDSGVSFLGSLNNNSEEIPDAEYGIGSSLLSIQMNRPPAAEITSEQENFSSASMPFSCIQENLNEGGHQFNQTRRRHPPLGELHGTTFAEECLQTPEGLKENELECASRDNMILSSSLAFAAESFTSDSDNGILGEGCHSTYLNQNPSNLIFFENSHPDTYMNRIAEDTESVQQDSLPRRPLIRTNAVECDPDKLKQWMTTVGSDVFPSQINNVLHQPSAVNDKQPLLSSPILADSVAGKLNEISVLSSMPNTVNVACNWAGRQNSGPEKTEPSHPVCDEMTQENANDLSHHDRIEQHSPSSVRKLSERSPLVTRQLISHCKSLDNVSLGADSKNVMHLAQNRSPSHGSLLTNEPETQKTRGQLLAEMDCLEWSCCKDISNSLHFVSSLKGIAQHKARRRLFLNNKADKATAITYRSKIFIELRSFYDQYREKPGDPLKPTIVVSEGFSSSDQNIRPRLTKRRSKNRCLRKRNSDPRLNVEGKWGSDLGRSKSDSSERTRLLQVISRRRFEFEQLKENFTSLENISLQKKIESSRKSLSAKDLSASLRNVNHHYENVKRKSVTIKDRDWHKELARQYMQSANSLHNLSPARKSGSLSTAFRFGREVNESFKGVTVSKGSSGEGSLTSLYTGKISKLGEIHLNDQFAGNAFDIGYKDTTHHESKSSQKTGSVSCDLVSSVVKPFQPSTVEIPMTTGQELSSTGVRELRENFAGLPSNSVASKVTENSSKNCVASPPSADSLNGKSSGRPSCEAFGQTMDDAQILDPANISWSVTRLKELYSGQHELSANRKPRTSHSMSEDRSSSKKALPRIG